MQNPGKGVKGNPLATSTLRGSSVAQTNLRYKEVHLNEVYGCAKSQEIELGNLQNLTKNNADLQNYVSNEQNRIEDARDYLELDNADDFDYER